MKFSIFTPTHKPGNLIRAAESLKNQTHQDYEWLVLVNGNGLKEIDKCLPKVKKIVGDKIKVSKFTDETDYIGLLKKECCKAATGDVLVEFDHDDTLEYNCLEELELKFNDPTVDFVYSDCFEWRKGKATAPYSEKFGWKYTECPGGRISVNYAEPSPLGFSYIWFAPNHVRSWRRSFYEKIGGHNVELDVCDDHEILCRTYIEGKCVRIPKPLYNYMVQEGENTCYGEKNKKIQQLTRTLHDKWIEKMVAKWCDLKILDKVDLCCGGSKPRGYIGVDTLGVPGVDIVFDLNNAPWPFADNSVGMFRMQDAIEHLKDPIQTMKELWRCLAPYGWAMIEVPSTDGRGAFQDPTHCCHSEDTEVLTTEGFVLFSKLKGNELFYVLNTSTNVTKTLPANKIHCYDHTGNMIHYQGRHIDAMVTLNHKMIVGSSDSTTSFRFMDAKDTLKYASPMRIPSKANFDGDYPEYFEIPNSRLTLHSNPNDRFVNDTIRLPITPFVKFLGWYISEGCVSIKIDNEQGGKFNYYRINVYQTEKANFEKYELLGQHIDDMGYKPGKTKNGWYFNDKNLALWLNNLGKSWEKYIPTSIKQLHPELLDQLLTTLILGDGCNNGTTSKTYATTSKQLAIDVQEIAIKCGYRTSVSCEHRIGKQVLVNPDYRCKHDMWLVYISKSKESYLPRNKKEVPYNGKVYCITVPEQHVILTRRNGKVLWSGNSYWNSNSFWYYTKKQQAQYIGTPVKFQCNRMTNYFPSDFHRQCNIPYVKAHLVKLLDDGFIPPKGREI